MFPQEQGGFTRVGFCHYHTLQEVKAEFLNCFDFVQFLVIFYLQTESACIFADFLLKVLLVLYVLLAYIR